MRSFYNINLILLASILMISHGYAGEGRGQVQIGHVGDFGRHGPLLFFYTTEHTNRPACNTFRERWVLRLDSSAAKEMYSLLLSAQIAEKEVVLEGSGNCAVFGGSETVIWVGFPVTQP